MFGILMHFKDQQGGRWGDGLHPKKGQEFQCGSDSSHPGPSLPARDQPAVAF